MKLSIEGTDYEVENGTSIGRSTKNEITTPNPDKYKDVSREHAKFVLEKGKVKIVDNDSKNGTYVNGQPVLESEIKPGDRIKLGSSLDIEVVE